MTVLVPITLKGNEAYRLACRAGMLIRNREVLLNPPRLKDCESYKAHPYHKIHSHAEAHILIRMRALSSECILVDSARRSM